MKIKAIILSLLLIPSAAASQTPAQPAADVPVQPAANDKKATDVLINQPYASKTLGDMTLPFMWEAQEDEKLGRLVVTESRTTSPAVMTVDLADVPDGIETLDVAREIASSLADQLGTAAEVTGQKKTLECGKKKCPSVDVYKAAFEGSENGIPRNCALQVVPAGRKVLVLTLCAHAERPYSPPLAEILDTFFGMMK